jgi:riboflavin synthase
MFTGIIECLGLIVAVDKIGGNTVFKVSTSLTHELKVDQSIAHNGVCLTIEAIHEEIYQVTAIEETLSKTNAGNWLVGDVVNLERAMQFNGRMDGHLVQGHVDAVATCIDVKEMDGSWQYRFQFPEKFASLMIEKGSVSLNGTSLTVFDVSTNQFSVAIIPYTYHHTNMHNLQMGQTVNIEFDMIGKYVARYAQLNNPNIH